MARPLDGDGQRPLMLGAGPGLTTGPNTAEFIHIAAQHLMLFVINYLHIVCAEVA